MVLNTPEVILAVHFTHHRHGVLQLQFQAITSVKSSVSAAQSESPLGMLSLSIHKVEAGIIARGRTVSAC